MIADVKNPARICEKIREAAEDHGHDPSMWPFSQLIGDLLRASVVSRCFNVFADAWSRIEAGFEVYDGNGRLKVREREWPAPLSSESSRAQTNLWTEAERPPDVLINLLVVPPRMPAVVAEVWLERGAGAAPLSARAQVQLHLRDVLVLKESVLHVSARSPFRAL